MPRYGPKNLLPKSIVAAYTVYRPIMETETALTYSQSVSVYFPPWTVVEAVQMKASRFLDVVQLVF